MEKEQYIHEDFLLAIIDNRTFIWPSRYLPKGLMRKYGWEKQKTQKYAGILKCEYCKEGFVARNSKTQTNGHTVTYLCSTFHNLGFA